MLLVRATPAPAQAQGPRATVPAVRPSEHPAELRQPGGLPSSADAGDSCRPLRRHRRPRRRVQGASHSWCRTSPSLRRCEPRAKLASGATGSEPIRQAADASAVSCCLTASNTATALCRETDGKSSRNSSREEVPSRYSNRLFTGTRVPVKQSAPLMISGSRLTSDESMLDSWRASLPLVACGDVRSMEGLGDTAEPAKQHN